MVFFTCNACGESLKKAAVEKHYNQKCRMCNVLTCIDCQKDFVGDEYKAHIKCISEEEKYSGKNFKPKANVNKGEQKQQQWTEQVQEAVNKVKADPKLQKLLESLIDYPNIPRKKAKFENFLKNSLRVWDGALGTRAWEAISAELTKPQAPVSSSKDGESPPQTNGVISNTPQKGEEEKSQKRTAEPAEDESPKKKKTKKKTETAEVMDSDCVSQDSSQYSSDKFKWSSNMVEVLEQAGKSSMSLKKFRKKVLKRFQAVQSDSEMTEDKLLLRFEKKLSRHSRLQVTLLA